MAGLVPGGDGGGHTVQRGRTDSVSARLTQKPGAAGQVGDCRTPPVLRVVVTNTQTSLVQIPRDIPSPGAGFSYWARKERANDFQ